MRTAVATMARHLVLVRHVDGDAVAAPPAATMSATADSAWSATTSATTTWAPSAAKSVAATRPMPLPAPVITATLPSSRAICRLLPGRGPCLVPSLAVMEHRTPVPALRAHLIGGPAAAVGY